MKGFSLVEIMLATCIAALFIVPLAGLISSLHPYMLLRDVAITDLSFATTSGTGTLTGSTSIPRTLRDEPPYINPQWPDASLFVDNTHELDTYHSYLVDEEIQGKSRCESFSLTSSQPHYFTSSELSLSTSTLPTGVFVSGDTLFVSLNSSSTTEPDFASYHISSDGSLQKRAAIDTGPGASDLKVVGFSAFVGNTSVKSQAQRIDVSHPEAPLLVKDYLFNGGNSATKPLTKKIYIYKNILIVGTEKSVLPEIEIFDIATGIPIASVETNYGINGFYVRDNILFVLSPLDPEIDIFDLTSTLTADSALVVGVPQTLINPPKIGTYDAPGVLGNGRSMDIVGDHIILGRSKGGDEVSLLHFPSPSMSASTKIGASVDMSLLSLNKLLVFTSSSLKRIVEYSVGTSTLTPRISFANNSRTAGAYCADNTLYVTMQSTSTPLIVFKPTQ